MYDSEKMQALFAALTTTKFFEFMGNVEAKKQIQKFLFLLQDALENIGKSTQ